ncbi:hypothetical protein BDZ97DRAFT_1759725 [Flammula alnicola]|nr:hypothetical protein BDZ97DRAFT_1759725 [Flammula alnicola]
MHMVCSLIWTGSCDVEGNRIHGFFDVLQENSGQLEELYVGGLQAPALKKLCLGISTLQIPFQLDERLTHLAIEGNIYTLDLDNTLDILRKTPVLEELVFGHWSNSKILAEDATYENIWQADKNRLQGTPKFPHMKMISFRTEEAYFCSLFLLYNAAPSSSATIKWHQRNTLPKLGLIHSFRKQPPAHLPDGIK